MFANSTGNRFGAVCRGSGGEAEVLSECPMVSVKYFKISEGNVTYDLIVTTDTVRADKVFFKIQFDAPIISLNVSHIKLSFFSIGRFKS